MGGEEEHLQQGEQQFQSLRISEFEDFEFRRLEALHVQGSRY